tara:strand:+ start:49646 stop:51247 length:1602 start_codon:yes stop_codon:yes gene_type:complete
MRIPLFLIFLALNASISCNTEQQKKNTISFADNKVIAHRGAWKANNHPQNSIASLKQAIELKCTGSEFDVRMTSDNILIVAHDADYNGLSIEQSTYKELSQHKLSNGEILPTLKQYVLAGMENNSSTGLICEIKPSKIEGRNEQIAEAVVQLVNEMQAAPYISSYISFSYEVLKKIQTLEPTARTQYLDGSKSPETLKNDGITGLDYLVYKLKKKPEWIQSAKKQGILLNAWTANKVEDIDWLLANDFNYITTDHPELVFERSKESPTTKGYELVWSDEFNYQGKPDSTKWNYDYGFISNNEKQYFTDSLKNIRVDNGHLIIEAHKEKIANKDYKSDAFKNKSWLKYIPEIDTAQYTSARLNTDGLASWKYGRIEVKAQLPKGVGLWPAIWMLGENRKQVGWPESGEIDIMEHVGFDQDSIFGTVHTKAYNHMVGTEKGKKIYIDKPYDTFHVFALEWTPEKMDFLLDDVVYNHIENEHKTTAEWPFDQKFHLILNVSVGGMLGGQKGIDDTVFPQQMRIDYVRVFQQKNNRL